MKNHISILVVLILESTSFSGTTCFNPDVIVKVDSINKTNEYADIYEASVVDIIKNKKDIKISKIIKFKSEIKIYNETILNLVIDYDSNLKICRDSIKSSNNIKQGNDDVQKLLTYAVMPIIAIGLIGVVIYFIDPTSEYD